MTRRKRRRQIAEINVVPYIDVMLVLLIIFMITAPLLQQGVEVELPQAAANPLPPETHEPLVLTVDHKGLLYLNFGEHQRRAVDERTVVNRVAAMLQYRPGIPVLVRGDTAVEYGRVTRAMVLLQKAGAGKIGLMTEQPDLAVTR